MQITKHNANSDLLIYEGRVGGARVKVLVDPGATHNFVSTELVKKLSLKTIPKTTSDSVRFADGSVAASNEAALLDFTLGEFPDSDVFNTLQLASFDLIVGKPWLRRHDPKISWVHNSIRLRAKGREYLIVSEDDPELKSLMHMVMRKDEVPSLNKDDNMFLISVQLEDTSANEADTPATLKIKEFLSQFEDVVAPAGSELKPTYDRASHRKIQHTIQLKEGAVPPVRGVIRLNPEELEELKLQLQQFTERGLIQPSTSPYGAPVLLVKKKSGERRLVIDYRMLNDITVKNKYPLPRIDDLLDRLHGAKYFSKVDLASGFYQVPLKEEDRPKTAFRTRFGSYEFKVMPMGLCNSPSTFQRLMDVVLYETLDLFVIVYLDDILIYSKTEEEHLKHVEIVLQKLREHKLLTQAKKCAWGQSKTDFLGHVVSAEGVQTDPRKVDSIRDWPVPCNRREVLSFLGLANFYRKFVKDYSKIAAPLTALTGHAPYQWGTEAQTAFDKLKAALTSAPILATPDFSMPFVIHCDASDFAVGQVLCQGEGKDERVIAYESRKLSGAEYRYPSHDKELLAVVHALRKWRHYLRTGEFTVITDNWATKYIMTKPDLNMRQARWLDLLSEYDFKIIHRKGVDNVVPDALSRRPDFQVHSIRATAIKVDSLLVRVARAAVADPDYQRMVVKAQTGATSEFELRDNLLYKESRLYIPTDGVLRQELLREAHDSPLAGHLGREKTLDRLKRIFFWPRMDRVVHDYCKTCPSCQAIKPEQTKAKGLLKSLEVPQAPWDSVSLDLITKLPQTKRGHTSIVVFVDRMTKMIYCQATTDNVTAEEIATLYHRAVFRHHGIPKSLVSDRDPKFTAAFWRALHAALGTKLAMSTSNHPQTDGQTERANRTLEDMLRAYVSPHHDDWDEHLINAEFAYNDSVNATTGYSPFYLNYGRHPHTPLSLYSGNDIVNESTEEFVQRMSVDLAHAREAMRMAQATQAKYANRHRKDCEFQVGDKVWLSAKAVRLPEAEHTSRKFRHKYHGPYEIIRKISEAAYELRLPANMKIHPVINISFLKANADGSKDFPHRPEYSAPPPAELIDGEEHFLIEAFRKQRKNGRTKELEILVKWAGHGEDQNDWVPAWQLQQDIDNRTYQRLLQQLLDVSTGQPRRSRRRAS